MKNKNDVINEALICLIENQRAEISNLQNKIEGISTVNTLFFRLISSKYSENEFVKFLDESLAASDFECGKEQLNGWRNCVVNDGMYGLL